jgi:hypothetical protein
LAEAFEEEQVEVRHSAAAVPDIQSAVVAVAEEAGSRWVAVAGSLGTAVGSEDIPSLEAEDRQQDSRYIAAGGVVVVADRSQ